MKPLIFLFFLCTSLCFSQQQYAFDYLLEYEVRYYKDAIASINHNTRKHDKTFKKYYLTNSKENNYSAVITELDSLHYNMFFKDENGISAMVNFLKTDLNNAEFIAIDCAGVNAYRNDYKHRTKDYDFFKLKDTVINEKTYHRIKLASLNPKKAKRQKLASKFYIIDKETSFHLPVLTHATAYEEWKLERNFPNGLIYQNYLINHDGRLSGTETLISYRKIDKKILIAEDCDYTKPSKKKKLIPLSRVYNHLKMD